MAGSRLLRDGIPKGSVAPPFDLPTIDAGRVRLRDYAGKTVFVVFSDPHCPPCTELAPRLQELSSPEVIVISRGDLDENRDKAQALGLTYPIALQSGWQTSRDYGMFSTPVGFLIGPDGRTLRDAAVGSAAILAAVRGGADINPPIGPERFTRRAAIFRFAAATAAALAAVVDPLPMMSAFAADNVIPLDLGGTWQLRDDLGGNRCSPNNPSEASFSASKSSATFASVSKDCGCCACSGRYKAFSFAQAFTTVGAHLKGSFQASHSGQYAVASFRVDLLIGGKIGTTKYFATEHRPNNNCTVPGTETLIPNAAEFDIPLDSIAVGTIDGIALAITGYGCCEASASGTLANTFITLPGAATTPIPTAPATPVTPVNQGSGFPWGILLGLGAGGLMLLGALGLLFGFDPCEELRKMCDAARAAAAAAAAKASAARAKATVAHKACDEARKVREKAENLTKAGESWIEGSEHPGERLTSGDLALQRKAAADLQGAFDRGEITRQELQDGLSHWADPNYWKQLREQAKADLKGAQEREAAACKAADGAEAEAKAAEAEAASLQAQADAICRLAAACVEQQKQPPGVTDGPSVPVTPPAPAGPPTPVTPTPPATSGPQKPDDHTHDHDQSHAPCCASGEYVGLVVSMEGGLGVISWALSAAGWLWGKIFGSDDEADPWFVTGHDYWQGAIYCVNDPSKFASFKAKSVRQGVGVGGGAGMVVIHCSGRDHPSDVVKDLPAMMSGLSGDIVGIWAFVKVLRAARKFRSFYRTLRLFIALRRSRMGPEVVSLVKWLIGENIIGKGLISSAVQGAPGCQAIPIGLSVQVGLWYNVADRVRFEVDEYGCCTHCAYSLAESGAEIADMKAKGW